jgi:UDP-N-acetylglucosamine--N-acetylmuramyl-(pentapeptide) pyrophosphoryl-undecaprenol N-acetylglucosamine transferase
MSEFDSTVITSTIIAGKLRRYNHLSVIRQLLWPRLVLSNIRDGFLVGIGMIQSIIKLIIWRPDVVFTKGGYVCLPVGIATKLLRIPLVIHDSDAHPGLTNRILSKWASAIATGAPLEYYAYPSAISAYVGIPISTAFHQFSSAERYAAKQKWGIDTDRPLIVVTGGGLGAKRINDTVIEILPELQRFGSVILVAGSAQFDELTALTPPDSSDFQLHPFVTDMPSLLGAADIVITRAGATTILELAALHTPTILVPNAKLTGGHQIKNAAVYTQKQAVVVVNEEEMIKQPRQLIDAVGSILDHPKLSEAMGERFATFARPNAAKDMADMIIASARK